MCQETLVPQDVKYCVKNQWFSKLGKCRIKQREIGFFTVINLRRDYTKQCFPKDRSIEALFGEISLSIQAGKCCSRLYLLLLLLQIVSLSVGKEACIYFSA